MQKELRFKVVLGPVHEIDAVCCWTAKVVKQKQEKIDFLNAELNATRDSVRRRTARVHVNYQKHCSENNPFDTCVSMRTTGR
eukprot:COSAG02_NODE_591_length_19862_cov_8.047918_9_plen_82_part_00